MSVNQTNDIDLNKFEEFDYLRLRHRFTDKIAEGLAALGFEKKRAEIFHRKTPTGSGGLMLGITKNFNCVDVTPSVFVRIEALEKVLKEFYATVLGRKYLSDFSAGGNIGNIRSNVFRKWQIYNENEIQTVIGEVVAMFEFVGIPYIGKYSDPLQLLDGLLDRRVSGNLCVIPGDSAKKAIVLALVLDRKDLFEQNAPLLHDRLENHPNGGVKEFDLLRDWLLEKFSG